MFVAISPRFSWSLVKGWVARVSQWSKDCWTRHHEGTHYLLHPRRERTKERGKKREKRMKWNGEEGKEKIREVEKGKKLEKAGKRWWLDDGVYLGSNIACPLRQLHVPFGRSSHSAGTMIIPCLQVGNFVDDSSRHHYQAWSWSSIWYIIFIPVCIILHFSWLLSHFQPVLRQP